MSLYVITGCEPDCAPCKECGCTSNGYVCCSGECPSDCSSENSSGGASSGGGSNEPSGGGGGGSSGGGNGSGGGESWGIIPGCIDCQAINWNPIANQDDATCYYEYDDFGNIIPQHC